MTESVGLVVGIGSKRTVTPSRKWVALGFADIMVAMVVGVGEMIATVPLSEAVTRGAARPKAKRRWLQVTCML